MFMFRKLSLHDITSIYEDMELRALLTVKPVGKKFGVVMDIDGCLKGGITGYIDGDGAMIQELRIKGKDDNDLYRDGLLRSSMHALELDGVKMLFTKSTEDKDIYTNIGFKKIWTGMLLNLNLILGDSIKGYCPRPSLVYRFKEVFNKKL